MAIINRVPFNALVDDAGTGTTGTPWNKQAIKDVLLDPIDAAIKPTYGTWTPTDRSGAGLVFTLGPATWARLDTIVFIWCQVIYPGTSNGAVAVIGGLPFVVYSRGGGSQGFGTPHQWYLPGADNCLMPADPVTGVATTNAQLSGQNLFINAVYTTA